MRLGAIDIGTNSIHLIVVDLDPEFGSSRVIARDREMVRLGAGDALARGELGRKAIERATAAIVRFVELARAAGAADVRAVATSAVREARNRADFIAAVKSAIGLDIEVLADTEEARLIHLGVSRGFPLHESIACIVDIGGGSTEFIIGDRSRPFFVQSVKLGSLRLYEEFLDGESSARAYRKMLRRIDALLTPVLESVESHPFDVMVATSGTALGLASLDGAARGVALERPHGYELRFDRILALQHTMLRMTAAERRKLPGMNPRRSDIIVAGTAILIATMERLGRDAAIVCDRALREGIVVDYIERNLAVAHALAGEAARKTDALRSLARHYDSDGLHEHHVAGLAVSLFDQLATVHGLEPADRALLAAAALVHDVGHYVNGSAHHKHGAYIVANAVLAGWSTDERRLLAAVVRYHRRAMPKSSHPEYLAFSIAERRRIDALASLLRIADGLDARHQGLVNSVEVRLEPGMARAILYGEGEIAPERAGGAFKADLFERTFGLRVLFEERVAAAQVP